MLEIQERLWCPLEMEEAADSLRKRINQDCKKINRNCSKCRHAVTVRCTVYINKLIKRKEVMKECCAL